MSETVGTGFRSLSPAEVRARVESGEEVFLVDVREPRQYHAGHIADAILLPADDFADRYTREIDPDDPVILVCEKGMTSEAAARFLLTQGFTDVATMAGGMREWDGPLVSRGD
jgi:rhodanese-related sulfurtransferase